MRQDKDNLKRQLSGMLLDQLGLKMLHRTICAVLICEMVFPSQILAATNVPAPGSFVEEGTSVSEVVTKETNAPTSTTDTGSQSAPSEKEKTVTALSMSSGTGAELPSSQWLNQFHFDPNSGTGIMALPLFMPSGRGKIHPTVALNYSSRRGNGPFGQGWGVDFGTIERSLKNGVPKYTSEDTFVSSLGGSSVDLVMIAPGEYRAKAEGAFMKFTYMNDDTWEVKDRAGNTYYFGLDDLLDDQSREREGNRIFRWHLSEIKDIYGNYCFIRHLSDGGFEVSYPGEPGTDRLSFGSPAQNFPFSVKAVMESIDRQDVISEYQAGFLRRQTRRVAAVEIYAANQLQRKYTFEYEYSALTSRSLLSRITEYGDDGTSALPPMTFHYATTPVTYQTATLGTLLDVTGPNQTTLPQLSGDFNGDGFTDIGTFYPDTGTVKIALATGSGFSTKTVWLANFGRGGVPLIGDYNADGRADFLAFLPWKGEWDVALSDGTKFVTANAWLDLFGAQQQPVVGDFNGDGWVDVGTLSKNSDTWTFQLAVNTKNRFESKPMLYTVGGASQTMFIADFNGDGLNDFGGFDSQTGQWTARLNPGDITHSFGAPVSVTSFGADKKMAVADYTSDGKTDLGYYDYSQGKFFYRAALGDVFGPAGELPFQLGLTDSGAQMLSGDFNGDGLMDFAVYNQTGRLDLASSIGTFTDLLTQIDNHIGGVKTVTYKSSTALPNTYLPFALPVIHAITMSDSRGGRYVTRLDYSYGLFNPSEREFYGFGHVRTFDADGNYQDMSFLQNNYYVRGLISQQIEQDVNGQPYAKALNQWATQDLYPGVKFVYLKRSDAMTYEDDSSGRRKAQEFFYEETPQLGNLTKTVQLGEVDFSTGADIADDKRTVETTYLNDTSEGNWLLGIPAHIAVKNSSGAIARQSWMYYDGHSGWGDPPTHGALTQTTFWGGDHPTAIHPTSRYSYDAYGNLVSSIDPRNNTTAISYDSDYHMFPLTKTNAMGHQTVNEYYGINGAPVDSGNGFRGLWGQLKSTTDHNQQEGRKTYDTFGRMVAAVSPIDSIQYPTISLEYVAASDYMQIKTHQRETALESGTVDSTQFYDGLGRLIQTKTESATTGQYVVGGQAEYNSRGLPVRKYLPFFSTNSFDQPDPIDPARPHATLDYDAMGRTLRITNPDNTYASISYGDWETSTIDDNGHKQTSYADAFGRLVKKEEYVGADGRSPHYPQENYQIYATTRYAYDSEGNLTQIQDAQGNLTTISYDTLGRKIAMDDPDMGVWQYAYDAAGNLLKQVDAKNQEINFAYDPLNRLVKKSSGSEMNVDYVYDDPAVAYSTGRLTQSQYGADDTNFVYDKLGREIQSSKTIDGVRYDVKRTYDTANRIQTLEYPTGRKIFYEYNVAGQVVGVKEYADQAMSLGAGNGLPFGSFSPETPTPSPTPIPSPTPTPTPTPRSTPSPTLSRPWGNIPSKVWPQKVNTVLRINHMSQRILRALGSFIQETLGVANAYAQAVPSSPVLNTAIPGNAQVTLGWSAVNGTTGYKVKSRNTANVGTDYTKDAACVGAWKFEESSGTIVSACKSNNGTVSGSLTQGVAGKRGKGIEFKGASAGNNAYVNFGSDASLDNLRARTIVAWIKPDNLGESSRGVILSKDYQDGWTLRMAPNNNLTFTQAFSGGVVSWTTTTNALSMGTFQHVAVTYAGNSVSDVPAIYVNGVRQTITSATPYGSFDNDAGYSLKMGIEGSIYEFDGVMDEVGVFNRVFSSAQVTEIMTQGLDGAGTTVTTTTDVGNVTSYTVRNLVNGTPYYFQVSAYNSSGESANSNELSATPQATILSAPVLNTATAGNAQVTLGWGAVTGATNYSVKYGTTSGVYGAPQVVGNVTSYAVTGLTNGTTYYFVVTASNASSASADSNEKNTTPQVPAPSSPVLNSATAGDARVTLSWSASSGATSYSLKVGTASGTYGAPQVVGNVTSYSVTGLVNGTTYYFVVTAVNAGGASPNSNEKSATPQAAVLSTPVLNTAIPGNAQVTLGWSAVNGATGYKVKSRNTANVGTDYTKDTACVGAWKFEESSGTIVSACKSNNGTVSGSLTQGVTGKRGKGIELKGVSAGNNAYVNFGSDASLDNLRARTIVAWIKPDNLGESSRGVILSKDYQDGWTLRMAPNNNLTFTQAFSGGVVSWTTTTNALSMGTFQHVAVTYAGNSVSDVPAIYVNGVRQTITSATPYGSFDNDAGYSLKMGIEGSIYEFDGVMDEVGVFNRVFSSAQVTEIMTQGLDGAGTTVTTTTDVGNVTSYTVKNLVNGTPYYFQVSAYNSSGESANSNQTTATPSVPQPVIFIKNVVYNASGQITNIEYGNGDVESYTYDPLNSRLVHLLAVNYRGEILQDLSYTYDSIGNIILIEDRVRAASQGFRYDALNRLIESQGSYGTKVYEYDAIGNVLQKDGVTYHYAEGGAGAHQVTSGSDGSIYSYDSNGNMVRMTRNGLVSDYVYDVENRLVAIENNSLTVAEYSYDGDGGRTEVVIGGPGGTLAATRYVGSLYEEQGALETEHVFLGAGRMAWLRNGQARFAHADHLGSTSVVTDDLGTEIQSLEYEPFGQVVHSDGLDTTAYKFTGKPLEDETGLYYYGARYYDPVIGRFLTPDSIVQSPGGNPQSFNRYSYCGNNPVNFVDPSGHWFFAAIAAIFKAVVAAVAAHPVIAGGIVGAASGGIGSYQATGTVSPFSIGMGAITGGIAGGTLGMSGAAMAKIGSAGFLLKASAGASLMSQVMGAAGLEDVSQGFQYASMGLGAAFLGYNMGIGIRDWAASNGTFYDVQSGSVLSNDELVSQYGRGGAKIFTNGISQSQGDALAMAAEKNANVLFYNPTSGSIADLTESFLGKMTFTESLSRQLAGVSLQNAAYIGYSQGSIITSNALLGMVHNGGRGVAAGSSVTMLAPAVSQARVYFSAYEAGIRSIGYHAKVFDIINVAGPNLSPINFVGGTIGATTTYGLKVHTSY